MARKTKDPTHAELKSILAGMLERDDEVTARAVARLHSCINNVTDFTRHIERRALLEEAQAKQTALRKWAGNIKRDGARPTAAKLEAAEARIRELEADEAARIASHLAMIHAVAEIGGTAKLLKFYDSYADIRDRLHRQQALPPTLTAAEPAKPMRFPIKSAKSRTEK